MIEQQISSTKLKRVRKNIPVHYYHQKLLVKMDFPLVPHAFQDNKSSNNPADDTSQKDFLPGVPHQQIYTS